jgi:hypothetical protein
VIKSLKIVAALQERNDTKAWHALNSYSDKLEWKPLNELRISPEVWDYVVKERKYDPRIVFCHPDILQYDPITSLYYRGLCGLSIKAVKDYVGGVESLERGRSRGRLSREKAVLMAQAYNTFICSMISGSDEWTHEDGLRTIIATLGISIDGSMRNRIGEIAEERIYALIIDFLEQQGLTEEPIPLPPRRSTRRFLGYRLAKDILMKFSSEPDISFYRNDICEVVIEIKGGIDPAGALERYGAAKKSFEHAVSTSPKCLNFYVAGVITHELARRIDDDRLVSKAFDLVRILEEQDERNNFLKEIFRYALRLS